MNDVDVILVDESDNEIGRMEKLQAHREGRLHRAFSVFVFDTDNKLLLHRRAWGKYHSAGLWTNTCCSHPLPGEAVATAASRRLLEEMGLNCELERAFDFIYRADLENGLTEHEFDHVFTGISNDHPVVDPLEVSEWRWADQETILKELNEEPEKFTAWFKIAFPLVLKMQKSTDVK